MFFTCFVQPHHFAKHLSPPTALLPGFLALAIGLTVNPPANSPCSLGVVWYSGDFVVSHGFPENGHPIKGNHVPHIPYKVGHHPTYFFFPLSALEGDLFRFVIFYKLKNWRIYMIRFSGPESWEKQVSEMQVRWKIGSHQQTYWLYKVGKCCKKGTVRPYG